MTSVLTRPEPLYGRTTVHSKGRRGRRLLIAVLVLALALAVAVFVRDRLTDDSRRNYLAADGWPSRGQAAVLVGDALPQASPRQVPAPIASMAKVMTAYLVLRAFPLRPGQDGFSLSVTHADVAMTESQRSRDESLVDVEAGESLTERQALLALLLPSANNVALMLARRVAGQVGTFVQWMNQTARTLGMRDTHYADPSGFDDATVSTAADQLLLARTMSRDATFSALVATPSADLPVAGTVHNTDTLLGQDGFVGTKTGSHDAAGGCFMFRARRTVGGQDVDVIGVVMGQRGHDLIDAGLYAARQLVRRVAA